MFTWSMTLAWTLVVPRLIGAEGMGMIATGMAVVALLQIALGAGTGTYVAREVVVSPERAARLVAAAWAVRLMLVPLFAVGVVIWAQVAGYGADQDVVLYLCGAATAVMLLGEPLLSYFQATERMHYMAVSDAINKASQGLVGIVMALVGFGAVGFAASWVAASVVILLLSVRWAGRYFEVQWTTTWHDLSTVARGGVVYWTGGLFFTIYLWIDTAMLSVMATPIVVGWYGVPNRLFGTFLIVATIVTRAYLPRLVAAHERSRAEFIRLARGLLEWVFALSLPVMTAMVVGAGPVVNLLYGPGYARAAPVLAILGVCLVPMCVNIVLGTIVVASKRQGRANWLMVGTTVFNPAVNAMLIPLTQHRFGNGALGAAISLTLTEVLLAGAGMMMFGRGIIDMAIMRRVCRIAVACGGMWLTVQLLSAAGPVVSLLSGCCVLVVLAILSGAVTPDERQQIERLAARRVSGLGVRVRGGRKWAGAGANGGTNDRAW